MKKFWILILALILIVSTESVLAKNPDNNKPKVNQQKFILYHVNNCLSGQTNFDPYFGHINIVNPLGTYNLIFNGIIKGLAPNTEYTVWLRGLYGYSGEYLDRNLSLGYVALTTFTTDKFGNGNYFYKINKSDLPTGIYITQVALNFNNDSIFGCTVAATLASQPIIISIH
jgi:hypothetical protein